MGTKTTSANFKLGWYTLDIFMSFKRFCFYLVFFAFVFSCLIFLSDPLKWGFDDLYMNPIPALTLYLGPCWAAKCLRILHRVPGRLIFLELHLCLPEFSFPWAWSQDLLTRKVPLKGHPWVLMSLCSPCRENVVGPWPSFAPQVRTIWSMWTSAHPAHLLWRRLSPISCMWPVHKLPWESVLLKSISLMTLKPISSSYRA